MNYKKGDLILVKNLDNTNTTCIVLSNFQGSDYLYCYCIEDSLYKLVYREEVQCVLTENFAPDFPEDDFFDLDYSFYSACFDAYQYWPSYVYAPDFDDDTEEK